MPDKIKPDTEKNNATLPEIPEMYNPGELTSSEGPASDYGFHNERLPKKYQDHLRRLVQTVAQIDMFARIEEVKRAAIQRFYWRSMFSIYLNQQAGTWQSFDAYNSQDTGDVPLEYPINIFQSYGKGFITQVGVVPSVRMEPTDPDNPFAARISASAEAMRRHIEYINKAENVAKDTARFMYTDGRTCFYNRWVCDGSRFGYEDNEPIDEVPEGLGEGSRPPDKKPRQPKGGALITPYGVLEVKCPVNMRDRADFPFIQLSYEIDLSAAKAMYPWISDAISGGEPGPGEYNFDRTTRIAISQGLRLLTQTGDTVHQLPTWQRTWLRPSYFSLIEEEEDRTFFEENFPAGCLVAFIGEHYAESRNESMDDHWEICHPLPGDGQSTPSVGYLLVAVQDMLNDHTDLNMEYLMKAIPAIIGDKGVFDFAAMSKQKAGPGARWPTKKELEPNQDLTKMIWQEPKVEPPAFAAQFYQDLLTTIPQLLTGLYPSVFGDAQPENTTKGGILALRDASRGQQGMIWKSFRSSYAQSMQQLIRIEAYYKEADAKEGRIELTSPGHGKMSVDLEDLRDGNFFCVPDGDESFPRTHEDDLVAFQALVTAAANGNQNAVAILNEPKNAPVIKDMISIPHLVVPGADETLKQLSEIAQLLEENPILNIQVQKMYRLTAIASAMQGKPAPPPPPPDKLYRTSIPIDKDFDNHAIEFKAGQDWINSDNGQQARQEKPKGFENVRLHLLEHKAQIDQAQQGAQQTQMMSQLVLEKAKHPATAPKSPAESIAFKDLGPSGQLQVGKQAGLDLSADVAQSILAEHTTPPEQAV